MFTFKSMLVHSYFVDFCRILVRTPIFVEDLERLYVLTLKKFEQRVHLHLHRLLVVNKPLAAQLLFLKCFCHYNEKE